MAYYSAYLLVQLAEDLKKQDLTADDIYLMVKGPTYSKIYNVITFCKLLKIIAIKKIILFN